MVRKNENNENNERASERFEDLLLDWMRTVTVFFIAGIALYHFTSLGKPYAIIAFMLSIVLISTMIIDYLFRRNELTKKGIDIRFSLDVIVAVMIIGLALILMITYEVIIEPYNYNPK